jgi:hypothetical protein
MPLLDRLFRRDKSKKIVFPEVNVQSQYVPRFEYDALEQRVRSIEQVQANVSITQKSEENLDFPSKVMNALPTVVQKTVRGIIHNYEHDFAEFCFWGMRKALIDAIRIRFKKDGKEELLHDDRGIPLTLPKWIELAKQERYISNQMAADLDEKVKVFGDLASHDYMVNLQREEVPGIFCCLRIALDRMYYQEEQTT